MIHSQEKIKYKLTLGWLNLSNLAGKHFKAPIINMCKNLNKIYFKILENIFLISEQNLSKEIKP